MDQQPQPMQPEPERRVLVTASLRVTSSNGRPVYVVRVRCPHCRRGEVDGPPLLDAPSKIIRGVTCLSCSGSFDAVVGCCYTCQRHGVWFCRHVDAIRASAVQSVRP